MNRGEGFTVAGVGVVACAACCAAPVLALLTATGIATVGGFVIFGTVALVVGALVAARSGVPIADRLDPWRARREFRSGDLDITEHSPTPSPPVLDNAEPSGRSRKDALA